MRVQVLFLRGRGHWTGCAVQAQWGTGCLLASTLRLAHTNLQPLQGSRIPGVPLWVSARRMTIQAKEMGFLFVFKHKGKSLLSLIRCHLKVKELYVLFPPAPPDSRQGGIEATLYSGLSVACLSSPSSPRGPASLPLKDPQL